MYLSILELEGWQPPPSSWKFLPLTSKLKQLNFCGICRFLQSSSDLDTLVIDRTSCQGTCADEDEHSPRFETDKFNCSLQHLKTINLDNLYGALIESLCYHWQNICSRTRQMLEKFATAAILEGSDASRDYAENETNRSS